MIHENLYLQQEIKKRVKLIILHVTKLVLHSVMVLLQLKLAFFCSQVLFVLGMVELEQNLLWAYSDAMVQIFLLQLSVYLLLAVVISHIGIASMPFSKWPVWAVMLVHIPALLLAAWIAKRWFSTPIYRFYLAKIEPILIGAKAA